MKVFQFNNYKEFALARIQSMPKGGRGQVRKIAEHLGMHTTLVSQVFRGPKNLSHEQACLLAEYFGLNDLETDYFLALVQHERAGSVKLKAVIERQLDQIRKRALELANLLPKDKTLTEAQRAMFYSNWYYSAVRLLSSVPGYQDVDSIAEYLGLSKKLVGRVVEFLIETGLCKEEDGKIQMAAQHTYLESDSPLVGRHHSNWRQKAIEHYPQLSSEELAFTAPLSISEKDIPVVRKILIETIERVMKVVRESGYEKTACFSVDWFRF